MPKKYKRKSLYWAILIVTVVLILPLVFYTVQAQLQGLLQKNDSPNATVQDDKITQFNNDYSQKLATSQNGIGINGLAIAPDKIGRPLAVVIENHSLARPQSGLAQADIVYEALAEGGITRFLALYQSESPNMIGPVRSARTYFNDWAQEWGALYAHVGGNSDALFYLKQGVPGIANMDQFYNAKYFWQIHTRQRPHNMYTSAVKILDFAKTNKLNMQKNYQDFLFKDNIQTTAGNAIPTVNPQIYNDPGKAATVIDMDFSLQQYHVQYSYDRSTNMYLRSLAGKSAIDANNTRIRAANVIVQIIKNWPVKSDTLYAISMGTRAGGNAYIFMDGKEITGTWKFVNGKTRYYDSSGTEISFNRGKFWIEMVPPAKEANIHVH